MEVTGARMLERLFGAIRETGVRFTISAIKRSRLLRSRDASLENGKTPGEHSYNGQGSSSSGHTDAFDRFLQDYKAHIDDELDESTEVRQPQPRRCGPQDSPSAPTRK